VTEINQISSRKGKHSKSNHSSETVLENANLNLAENSEDPEPTDSDDS